jgi:hypothetical protein
MAEFNITNIRFRWKGTWTGSFFYRKDDVVYYEGKAYVCLNGHDATNNFYDNFSDWVLILDGITWENNWTVDTFYSLGNVVKYGGIVYKCISAHQSASTIELGLEENANSWEIFIDGVEYKEEWKPDVRYKKNDIVKWNGTLWIVIEPHLSQTALSDDGNSWAVWVPGLTQVGNWQSTIKYGIGDIVLYGGNSYKAIANSQNVTPDNSADWELVTTGINYSNFWNISDSYRAGDLILNNGYLYIALTDNQGVYPDSDNTIWRLLTTSTFFRAQWIQNEIYYLGDIVTVAGTTYVCVQRHTSTEIISPITDVTNDYWKILIQGTLSNQLQYPGDLKTGDINGNATRFPIGVSNTLLKVSETLSWEDIDILPKIYYVSPIGEDTPLSGQNRRTPFKTIKYACDYILQDQATRAPATIFVLTGSYKENLPISVPADVVIVGDELRSVTVMPNTGFELSDMFYMRNGTGLRNMTLSGLNGTLGPLNDFLTRRPTAGAYVSLDPGTGPNDETVWISNKSPYIQNVTTLGTGCVGLKVDGTLHAGGFDSIVANDFTQVISDGIGVWVKSTARSELVSVFTYYCHIGYLTEEGGKIRATNGNTSYGDFGAVSEGVDPTEIPITGEVDNRSTQAIVDNIVTFGTNEQLIIALGYDHAGQNYTDATITFNGSGTGATGYYSEFRDNAISYFEITDLDDEVDVGGFGYQFVTNNAQTGDETSIQLSQADIGGSSNYEGMRIVIQSGLGVGQYGYIDSFDPVTKECIVKRESDNEVGWDHLQPGWPIESVLDITSRYVIEPRVLIEEPPVSVTSFIIGAIRNWKYITKGSKFVTITAGGSASISYAISSEDGFSWGNEVQLGSGYTMSGITWSGEAFLALRSQFQGVATDTILRSTDAIAWSDITLPSTNTWIGIASDGNGTLVALSNNQVTAYSVDHGATWNAGTVGGSDTWDGIVYGNGQFIVFSEIGNIARSTDGINWTFEIGALPAKPWTEITYGNGRFVAVSTTALGDSGSSVSYSFNGIDWYTNEISEEFTNITYGAGVFILTGPGTKFARSAEGKVWRLTDRDNNDYQTTTTGSWGHAAYGNGIWVVVNTNSNNFNRIATGAQPIVRVNILTSRITKFVIFDTGSNFTSVPSVTVFDPNVVDDVTFDLKINNGVLPQPEMISRGSGYFTANALISGNGFAERKQIGNFIVFKNLTEIPGPGANIIFAGDDTVYTLVRIEELSNGSAPYSATIRILPRIQVKGMFNHETQVSIRINYSQIRLTGHDFLDVGTGNFEVTDYPNLYLQNTSLGSNTTKDFNETINSGGGRVFYTSTDQDGNFRVGELFEVRQASGTVTLNASQFDLSGLTELALGGVRVGGSTTVIREFSTDGTFIADSDNIVSTQAAIIKYVTSRITGGSDSVTTNTLIAGQVRIIGNTIDTTSDLEIIVPVVANITKGFTGTLLALQYYSSSNNNIF